MAKINPRDKKTRFHSRILKNRHEAESDWCNTGEPSIKSWKLFRVISRTFLQKHHNPDPDPAGTDNGKGKTPDFTALGDNQNSGLTLRKLFLLLVHFLQRKKIHKKTENAMGQSVSQTMTSGMIIAYLTNVSGRSSIIFEY